jgi:hypothetical protein
MSSKKAGQEHPRSPTGPPLNGVRGILFGVLH